jgi:hypothetical protein
VGRECDKRVGGRTREKPEGVRRRGKKKVEVRIMKVRRRVWV